MKKTITTRFAKMQIAGLTALAFAALTTTSALAFHPDPSGFDRDNDGDDFRFDLVRSAGLVNFQTVAPNAHGRVKIESVGPVEIMKVTVWGLPPHTDFDVFVIQVPNKPFGMAWYQGDIETNKFGVGHAEFVGRFNIETFMVAQGVAPAPADPFTDPNRIPDATQNPVTNPIQMYHIGIWFNNPADVVKPGGPGTVTPFNGEHNAGVQVLNSGQFADTDGPLKRITRGGKFLPPPITITP
jgi:endonuclease YncB( thermonuclease family)